VNSYADSIFVFNFETRKIYKEWRKDRISSRDFEKNLQKKESCNETSRARKVNRNAPTNSRFEVIAQYRRSGYQFNIKRKEQTRTC